MPLRSFFRSPGADTRLIVTVLDGLVGLREAEQCQSSHVQGGTQRMTEGFSGVVRR
jgi:hypothetical protein